MTEVRELGEEEIKRISLRVRNAIVANFGKRGASFIRSNSDILTIILKETWMGVCEELERPK